MPLSLVERLRYFAVRCARLARDCNDAATTAELEAMSMELVETAAELTKQFTIGEAPTSTSNQCEPNKHHGRQS
jgi:hypothetical protein